jgi:hypothetical protein
MKPHLKLVGDSAIPAPRPMSPAVVEASKKYGKPFAYEKGADFKWTSGPTVLDAWKAKRMQERA